jgi:hypothetical protein
MFETATLRSGFNLQDSSGFAERVEHMLREAMNIPQDAKVSNIATAFIIWLGCHQSKYVRLKYFLTFGLFWFHLSFQTADVSFVLKMLQLFAKKKK